MLILRTRDGVPALDAVTDEAGHPVAGVTRIVIEIDCDGARARIERAGAGKGQAETIEVTVTKLAAWFEADEAGWRGPSEIEPKDPAQRLAAIGREIGRLDRRDTAHFTEDGKPDANVLSDRLGWRVSARERDEAWRQAGGETGTPATDQTKEG
jgi:hypothetical protein